jgi:hypothetical protein
VLHEVEQSFIDQQAELWLKKQQGLLLDLDLTHRQVSNTSTTHPDADFGWQDDKVVVGYDAALFTMTSQTWGRLFLSGFHHPCNTMSLLRLQQMVYAAEKRLGRRPRRQTELVAQRLHKQKQVMAREHHHEPVPVILSLDAGFGTGPNLAWLIEKGLARGCELDSPEPSQGPCVAQCQEDTDSHRSPQMMWPRSV